jgi:hypothetical protein
MDIDIFEVFPDGTCVWRACVSGRYQKDRKLQELAETSDNKFYAVNLAAGKSVAVNGESPPIALKAKSSERIPMAASASGGQNKGASAR